MAYSRRRDHGYSWHNTGQLTNAFDFEQVSITRASGDALWRNTIGGVINVRRSRPTKEFGVKAEATLGNDGREEFNAVLNVGDGDTFGLKVWGFDRSTDGYYDNVTLGTDAGANNNTNFGATLLLEPTPDLEILITAEKTKLGGDPPVSSISDGTDLICILLGAVIPEQCNRNLEDDLLCSPAEILIILKMHFQNQLQFR